MKDKCNILLPESFAGIVLIDTSFLIFKGDDELTKTVGVNVGTLSREFGNFPGCDEVHLENSIPALVNSMQLGCILRNLQMTRGAFRTSTLFPPYPEVNPTHMIHCLGAKAGENFLSLQKRSWPIRLYCVDQICETELYPDRVCVDFLEGPSNTDYTPNSAQHKNAMSDGDVYRKIRACEKMGRKNAAQRWKTSLSQNKRDNLSQLSCRPHLVDGFDSLLDFPGLWSGFELGNIKKVVALHCDEEVLAYLCHIYNVWHAITLGDASIERAVDVETVQNLEVRAPSVSKTDCDYIQWGIRTGTLFPKIKDASRRKSIEQALLSVKVIIPTIKTFHENLKYFGIGAEILKTQLVKTRLLTTRLLKTRLPDEGTEATLYEAMQSQWSSQGDLAVEWQEGEFQRIHLPDQAVQVRLSYIQVFLSALRNFPFLNKKDAPRVELHQEKMDAQVDPTHLSQFLSSAHILGFTTNERLPGPENIPEPVLVVDSEPYFPLRVYGEPLNHRCGRPFASAFQHFRTRLFLPNLTQAQTAVSLNPSVMFVQHDFVNAFFGPLPEIPIVGSHMAPLNVSTQLVRAVPTKRKTNFASGNSQPAKLPGLLPPLDPSETAPHRALLQAPQFCIFREPVASPDSVASCKSVASAISPGQVTGEYVSPGIVEFSDVFGGVLRFSNPVSNPNQDVAGEGQVANQATSGTSMPIWNFPYPIQYLGKSRADARRRRLRRRLQKRRDTRHWPRSNPARTMYNR